MCLTSAEEYKNAGVHILRDELNRKTNKNVYIKNDVMSTVIKRCRGEKKEKRKKKKRQNKNRWI